MHNKEYRIFKKVLLHIALLIVVLISIFPFIWMLTGYQWSSAFRKIFGRKLG